MGRKSTKTDKSVYQIKREELGLSREKAADLLEVIPPERIERLESGKYAANPDEVVIMAEKYNDPQLCNYYCSKECAIGQKYVPEIKIKDLSQIVLDILYSLNSVEERKKRLMEIAIDGLIEKEEIKDFIDIQDELERISIAVDTLKLWSERMISSNKIDLDVYLSIKKK